MSTGRSILLSLSLALCVSLVGPTSALAVPPPHTAKHTVKDQHGRVKVTAVQTRKYRYALYNAAGELSGSIRYLRTRSGAYYLYYDKHGRFTGYSRD